MWQNSGELWMRLPRRKLRLLWLAAAMLVPWSTGAQTLPDGAGKDVVERACGVCHPTTQVMGRNMSRDQWASEVRMMVQEGAKLTDVEFTQTVDYLAKAFPAGRDTTPADRGRAVYMSQCATCHGPRDPKLVGKEIGPSLKKAHPMRSGNPAPSLTEPEIVDLSHFLHQMAKAK